MMRRTLMIALACVGATCAGAASATVLVPAGEDTVGGDARVQPDGGAVYRSEPVADPDREQPAWAVRVYRSQTGQTCADVGHVDGAAFGPADASGKVQARSVQASGGCANLETSPAAVVTRSYPARPGQPARVVLFGVAGPKVTSLTLAAGGKEHELPRDAAGTFLVATDPKALQGATLTIRGGTEDVEVPLGLTNPEPQEAAFSDR